MRKHRYSDNDRHFGPFTLSLVSGTHFIGLILDSGDYDESPGCHIKLYARWFTLLCELPPIVRPYVERTTLEGLGEDVTKRLGRDWLEESWSREYGFYCYEGHLRVLYGAQTADSLTSRSCGWFLPWTEWRHTRHSIYEPDGTLFWDSNGTVNGNIEEPFDAREVCPKTFFAFKDFDDEQLTANVVIEEREWRKGDGWFKWLSWFRRPRVHRYIDIEFSGETGRRKGDWKGGTVATSVELQPGETTISAFQRYCRENEMVFLNQISTQPRLISQN